MARYHGHVYCCVSGKGIGSIVTGSLFDPVTGIGPVWTFRAYGFFALALFILYSLLCFFLLRGKDTPTKTRKANFDMAIKNGPGTYICNMYCFN